jgi:hypothetical protein
MISPRRGMSGESFTGTLTTIVYSGADASAVVGIVVEEATQSNGTAMAHYVPIGALSQMSFQVIRHSA